MRVERNFRNAYIAASPPLEMGEEVLAAKSREIKRSIEQLRAHLAWQALKEGERTIGGPPALMMDSNLAADIRNEACHFLRIEKEFTDALKTTIWIGGQDRQRYRRELRRLNEEFRSLDIPKGT